MEGWKEDQLRSITNYIGRGKSPVYIDSSEYSIINQACVFSSSLNFDKVKYVTNAFWKNLANEKRVEDEDILINSTGTGTLGRIGFIEPGDAFNSTYDSHITVVRFNPFKHHPKFFFYLFQHHSFKKQIDNFCTTGSTNQIELSKNELKNTSLIFPISAKEQRSIAKILTLIDKSIAQTKKIIDKYQAIKSGLMQDLLAFGIDRDGKIRCQSTHDFIEQEGSIIPKTWKIRNLSTICSLIKDGTHLPPKRVEEGIWLLGVANISNGELTLLSSDTKVPLNYFEQMHKNWTILPGDVLLAIVGATIGKVTQVPSHFPKFTLQRSVCLLRGKHKVLSNTFLKLYMESAIFQKALWAEVNVTAQPGVYLDTIGKLKITIPPFEEQCKIVDFVAPITKVLSFEKTKLSKLQSLKIGLMQNLLTGELKISETLINQLVD